MILVNVKIKKNRNIKTPTELIIMLGVFFLVSINLKAQDIHFSQFDRSPLNLNPAETGNFNADHRIIANYRNQWASVTVPYKTFSASYENLQRVPFDLPGNLGFGLIFNSDVAGDGNFGTVQIKLSAAYQQLNLLDSTLKVSMGFNGAYNQHSLDFHRLYFDSQYNGVQFDPGSQTNETYSSDRFSFFDFSLGFNVSYLFNRKIPLNFGIVFNHLNRPKQSFFEEEINRLEGKFNSYISADLPVSKYWTAKPLLFFYRQGEFNELFYGLIFEKELNNLSFRTINFGLINRSSDALIFRLGFNYESFDIGFSYDLNYSSLRVASRGIGAFEISVIYLMHNLQRYEPMFNRQCPVFL